MENGRIFNGTKRVFCLAGLYLGALLAFMVSAPFRLWPRGFTGFLIALCLYAFLMAFGWEAGGKIWAGHSEKNADLPLSNAACPKVLDTSVIIDGRIFDICKAGFLEGELVIPAFVLDELRHISDSADPLKRNRGRRGLDILQKIREELAFSVRVEERDWDDAAEVDVKLLRLARELNGAVLTNDYNLNKVAGVTQVPVLNINELAGALRPVVLPGEEMRLQVVREGKEPGQGVGYLDDGTMVVVENGRKSVGETLDAEVTTVLQTSAGRMIFARKKSGEPKAV